MYGARSNAPALVPSDALSVKNFSAMGALDINKQLGIQRVEMLNPQFSFLMCLADGGYGHN